MLDSAIPVWLWLVPLILLVSLLSLLAGVVLVLWWLVPRLEHYLIFRPSREMTRTPADAELPFEQHFIETPDGCRLSAWHLRPESPVAAVVYFHGNGGNLGILLEVFELLYRADLQVLAVDYRGYGWSTGYPTEEGLYQDGLASVRYFKENLQEDGLPLLYWGRSLGSCVAAHTAAQESPDGLILETAFPSKRSMVKYFPQFSVFYPFTRCRLHTLRYLRNHLFPVLLVHGDQDRTVPIQEGQLLYDRLTGPRQFLRIEGANHINLHRVNPEMYLAGVLDFARQSRPPVVH